MVCSIDVSADGKYIIQTITGEMTRSLALQYNLEAHARGAEVGLDRYLVDLRNARNVEPVTSNYEFAYGDMQETPGIDKYARVAVLVSPDDHSHDFIEIVAHNAGLDVTLFCDLGSAIKHLLD